MSGLDYERAVLSGGPVGIMQAVMDIVIPYIHERKQFGQAIGEFQLIKQKLQICTAGLQASRAYAYAVGGQLDNFDSAHVRHTQDCAALILYVAELATKLQAMVTNFGRKWLY